MAGELVARRYAKALLDIGISHNNLQELRGHLEDLGRLVAEVDIFREALLNPSIRLSERRSVMREIADKRGWDPLVRSYGLLLLDNDRVRFAPVISAQFNQMVDAHMGNIRAHVTSAQELNALQKMNIQKALSELTGKKVLLDTTTDPTLIGGAVTRIGGTVYDGSIKSQIARLRQSILAGV